MTTRSRTAAVVFAALLLLAVGCGSGSSTTGGGAGDKTTTHQLDEKSNAKTVSVHFGDTIVVTLHSTYWSFRPPTGNILQPVGPPSIGKGLNCPSIPGSGCGSVSMTYNVGKVGSGGIAAHRDSCGEAVRCVGTAADWAVRINAT
jgi:uncharacterized protein YceK